MVSSGMPLYGGKGISYHLSAGGYFEVEGFRLRFGLELLVGASAVEGVSNANKNAFTINGKLHKLGAVDMPGVDHANDQVKVLNFTSRKEDQAKRQTECDIVFEEKNRMSADVNAVVVYVGEAYSQGFINGWCYSAFLDKEFKIENIDALVFHDRSVY